MIPAPCVPGDEQVCWIHVPPVGLVGGCRSERRSSATGLTAVNDLQGESMSCCLYFKSPPVGLALGRVSDFFFFFEERRNSKLLGRHRTLRQRLVEVKTTNQHLGPCLMHPTSGVVLEPFDDLGQSQFVI